MPVLTRSAAKAHNINLPTSYDEDEAFVEVTVSATGQGIHTKWHYPSSPAKAPKARGPIAPLSPVSSASSFSSSSSSSGTSYLSIASSESSAEGSDLSFYEGNSVALPTTYNREPQDSRNSWENSGVAPKHIILVPDTFDELSMAERARRNQINADRVFDKQWEILMKTRDCQRGLLESHEAFNVKEEDIENQALDRIPEEAEYGLTESFYYTAYSRATTEALSDSGGDGGTQTQNSTILQAPDRQHPYPSYYKPTPPKGKPLGPCGTEIILHDTYIPPIRDTSAAYPTRWTNITNQRK